MKNLLEKKYKERFKLASALLGVLVLIFLLMMFGSSQISTKWRQYQSAYRDSLVVQTNEKRALDAAQNLPIEIHQTEINQLSIVDRCISCHRGIDEEMVETSSKLFKSHPKPYLDHHHESEFGCTTCHGGRGQALVESEAHSEEHAGPFLKMAYIQANCGKCHLLVYDDDVNIAGAVKLQQGVSIFQNLGCLGCHSIRGTGGAIGPDLTEQGAKPPEAYDYTRVSGGHNIETWLAEHFINPEAISPGSKMPAFNLSPDSLMNLVIFARALYPADLPFSYYNSNVLREYKNDRKIITDSDAFAMFCLACHGKNGNGRDYELDKFGVPHLGNQDFLRMASREMILFSIHEGRGTRMMGSWNPDYSGIRTDELGSLVDFVQSRKSQAHQYEQRMNSEGNASEGKKIYQKDCAMCHGEEGNGGIGPGLNRQSLLTSADNTFLYRTITTGRANTAMPSWSDNSAREIADLLKYIRHWQTQSVQSRSIQLIPGNETRGDSLYHYLCSRCHGTTGSGGIGPAILYPDFLSTASDNFLTHIILGGRDHSVMFGLQAAKISSTQRSQQIGDLVTFMRSWQDSTRSYIETGPDLGNPEYGKILYRRYCGACHGEKGEGVKAPALNNQEFLNAASNGYIIGTISLGREGTKMPSWGRGSEKHPHLETQDRWDVVAYVRQWQVVDIPLPIE